MHMRSNMHLQAACEIQYEWFIVTTIQFDCIVPTHRSGPGLKPVKHRLRAPNIITKFGAPKLVMSYWCSGQRTCMSLQDGGFDLIQGYYFCNFALGMFLLWTSTVYTTKIDKKNFWNETNRLTLIQINRPNVHIMIYSTII